MSKKISDEILLKEYEKTHSVWKTAKNVGMCGQSVHERLSRLNAIKSDFFTEEEKNKIRKLYREGFESGDKKLDLLSKEMGRQKTSICRFARKEGLTNLKRKRSEEMAKSFSIRAKEFIKKNGHPKGMLGKKHTKETLKVLSKHSKEMWEKLSKEQRAGFILKRTKNKLLKGSLFSKNRESCSWKAAWRTIGGKKRYFRSSWEANYARYLEYLKTKRKIKDWEHEKTYFWFEDSEKWRGVYLPDFEVELNSGNKEFHEVKGWYDQRSKTKISLMKKFYPEIVLKIILQKQYKKIEEKFSSLIEDWEFTRRRKKRVN